MANQPTSAEVVKRVEDLSPEFRWRVALNCIRKMIRLHRNAELSEAAIENDPKGELALSVELYQSLTFQMTLADAVKRMGGNGHRPTRRFDQTWYTMMGSYLHLLFDLNKVFAQKSIHDVFAQACGDYILLIDEPGRPDSQMRRMSRFFSVTTKNVVTYFLLHSDDVQRRWLVESMAASPRFKIVEVRNIGPQIEAFYPTNEPTMDWEPKDIRAQFDERLWYLQGGCKFGQRNDLSDSAAEEIWSCFINESAVEQVRVRNRLLRAIRACNSFCSAEQWKHLLAFARSGKTANLIEMIEELQHNPEFHGRGYRSKKFLTVWSWYQTEIANRDQLRCQHCGRFIDELDDPDFHIDHILPLDKGGRTYLANLQLLCSICNSKKGRKYEADFPSEVQTSWFKNRGTFAAVDRTTYARKRGPMMDNQFVQISVRVKRIGQSRIEVTFYPDSPVQESDYFERASYIGKLQLWSDELFDLLADKSEWYGEFQVKRKT